MKRIILLFLLIITLLFSTSCEFLFSNMIVGVEIGSFPSNIVYYVGESNTLDLVDGTVLVHTKGKTYGPGDNEGSYFREHPMSKVTGNFSIVSDIDFSVPGVYEVHVIWYGGVERFPVQVIER